MADLCFALPSSGTLTELLKNSDTQNLLCKAKGFTLVFGGFLENCASTSTKADPASPQLPKVTAALQALPCHLHITQLKTNTPSPLATAAQTHGHSPGWHVNLCIWSWSKECFHTQVLNLCFPAFYCTKEQLQVGLFPVKYLYHKAFPELLNTKIQSNPLCKMPELSPFPPLPTSHQSWEEGSPTPFCRFVLNTAFPSLKDLACSVVTKDAEGAACGCASLVTLQVLCCNRSWRFFPC